MQCLIGYSNELGVDVSALGSDVHLEKKNDVFLAKSSWTNVLGHLTFSTSKTKLITLSPGFAPLSTFGERHCFIIAQGGNLTSQTLYLYCLLITSGLSPSPT